MKITEVKIEKFRSIKKAVFRINDITAVVGENNAGKTAVLRAINSVLNYKFEESSFISKKHQYALRSNTYISITFCEIPTKQIYTDKIYDGTLTIKFSFTYSENKKRYVVVKGKDEVVLDDIFLQELSKDITYVYIPAGRTNKDVTWSDSSILMKLITSYSAQYTEKRDIITSHVKQATKKIHDTVLSKMENKINNLYMQNRSMDFKIDFPEGLDYTFLLDKIEISLNEYGSNYLLQEWGSGTKSLAVIAMHRAFALLNSGSIILGIEEPETNLHPQAQKRFIMSLKEHLHSNETQTIFTTHSTVLVDSLGHDDILLIRRDSDESRGFISIVSQIPADFWTKYNLEEFKHYQYFNYKNSDFFFSKYVVLGESKNDCQVLEKLVASEIGNKIADVSFLDAGGVENIKYPYYLLKELGIPFITVVDRDYFFPYLDNNKLEASRSQSTGLPCYGNVMKNEDVLNDIFKTETEKQRLVENHVYGYRKFFEYIKQYKILSMNYCMEMDLTCSSKARDEYYRILNTLPVNKNQKYLLENNAKAIKKIDKILSIIDTIPQKAYPESYLKIRNTIIDDIYKFV
jgi:putative ATP-dependent endonuclease of OLD family